MDQIFDLVVGVQGGQLSLVSNFTFTELYQMPINVRNYYYKKYANLQKMLNEKIEQEQMRAKGNGKQLL